MARLHALVWPIQVADAASWAGMRVPGFRITRTSTGVTFSPDGRLAYMSSRNEVTADGRDGTPVTAAGRAVTIWRLEPDGEWRRAIDVGNAEPAA